MQKWLSWALDVAFARVENGPVFALRALYFGGFMRQRLFVPVFVLVLACVSVPFAGEKDKDKDKPKATDNPFRTAKVGDFVSYKMTTKVAGNDLEGTMKTSVTEVNEKTVKLKSTIAIMGFSLPGPDSTVDLTKPYDPIGAVDAVDLGQKGGKFEKTGEGKEKLKVAGKEYEANWITGKSKGEAKGVKIDSEIKIWFSKAVPLNGMLKMEAKASIANIVLELSEIGGAKKKD
jgi:hypothetical protein